MTETNADMWEMDDDALVPPESSGRAWLVLAAALAIIIGAAVIWAVTSQSQQGVLDGLGVEIDMPAGWVDVTDDLEDNPVLDELPELRFDEWRAVRDDGEPGTPIAQFTMRRGDERDPAQTLDAYVENIFGDRDDVVETGRGTFDVEGGTGVWVIHESDEFGLTVIEASVVISWGETGIRVAVVGTDANWHHWDGLLEALEGARLRG